MFARWAPWDPVQLLTAQMGAFTLWVSLMTAGTISAGQRGEFVFWVLTAAAWVVTDSYRGDRGWGATPSAH
jgi:hypothetical protein